MSADRCQSGTHQILPTDGGAGAEQESARPIYIYLKDEWIARCDNLMSQLSELTGGRPVPVHEVVHGEEVLWFVPQQFDETVYDGCTA